MGKKYLETKEKSLESSVLGIWQEAAKKEDELEEAKFSPKEIKMAIGVASDKRYAGGNMTGAVKAIDKIKKGLSGHPQVAAVLKRQNENITEARGDGFLRLTFNSPADVKKAMKVSDTEFGYRFFLMDPARTRPELDIEGDKDSLQHLKKFLKKAKIKFKVEMEESVNEAQSGGKEEYQKFFNAALKKFKVKSPAELKGENKKKFYDYIDANWEGDNEKAEGAMSQVREFKMATMKSRLADIWGMKEGKNPFKKEEEEKEKPVITKGGKTLTGKKPAEIDVNPKIKA